MNESGKKKRKLAMVLAIVIALAAVALAVVLIVILPKKKGSKTSYEVTFALPKKYEALADVIVLPEKVTVQEGTGISTFPLAEMESFVFTGWYYDDSLELPAGRNDTVTQNVTLYPSFSSQIGRDAAFRLNYVSSLDVEPDFSVEIVAYGLTRAQILERLRVRNITLGGKDEPFFLEEKNPTEEEEQQEILPVYIPGGRNLVYPNELKEAFLEAGIDPENPTEKEIKGLLGLDEDDSLIRYYREEMGMDIETVLMMQRILDEHEMEKKAVHYILYPAGEGWMAGATHQVEITDTAFLRFVFDGQPSSDSVDFYNFSVFREEVNNLTLAEGVVFVPASEVKGVDLNRGIYSLTATDDGITGTTGDGRGKMQYDKPLENGAIVAIYDGNLNGDNTVDGNVSYVRIIGKNPDGEYLYENAEFTDVIEQRDILPIPDDGSPEDGIITVDKSALDFSDPLYIGMNLGASTTVNPGDFLAFYKGDISKPGSVESTGYGLVESISESDKKVTLTYKMVTKSDLLAVYDMYSREDNLELPMTPENARALETTAKEQIMGSGFVEETRDYVSALLTGEEYNLNRSQYKEELQNLSFQTDAGEEISLEELQKLADGAKKVKVTSGPEARLSLGTKLNHFTGNGLRGEVTVGLTIEIELNKVGSKQNKIEIKVYAALEQEITLGLDISTSSDWEWYLFIPVLKEIHVSVSFRAGTYTGFGGSITVMTGSDNTNEDTPWNKLITTSNAAATKEAAGLAKMGEKLENMGTALKSVQNGGSVIKEKGKKSTTSVGKDEDGTQYQGVGGDLQEKYSAMLDNDAEYINLFKFQVFRLEASPDPLHLIAFSFEADLVASLKINAMLGFGISYANAKQYCFNIDIFSGEKSTSDADLETPNFRADAYAFGMIGVRGGVLFDARVGLISTKLDSLGITAEAGFYAEVYGFVYVSYTWESGKGSSMSAQGSVYFEVGTYLNINFVAQLGDGKLSTGTSIYSKKWPLVKLGAEKVPMEFEIDADDAKLTIEFPKGKNTIKLPDELYKISMMSLSSGKLAAESQDSKEKGDLAYKFNIYGNEYSQFNEKNFSVTCTDLDGAKGKALSTHSFLYMPETNEVYVRPSDQTKDEYWGKISFVYKNNSFGFNTLEMQRDVYVHWKGSPVRAEVMYYVKNDNGEYEYLKSGEFNGYDGVTCELVIDEDFVYQLPGYKLTDIVFDDELLLKEKVAEYEQLVKEKYNGRSNSRKENDEYWDAVEKQDAAWEAYDKLTRNVAEVVRNQKGTLQFPIVSNETVVRLKFDPKIQHTEWFLNPSLTVLDGHRSFSSDLHSNISDPVPVGMRIMDYVPDDFTEYIEAHPSHEFHFYYYTIPGEAISYEQEIEMVLEALAKESEWKELTPEVTAPPENLYIFCMEESAGINTLTWYLEDKILDQEQVRHGINTIPRFEKFDLLPKGMDVIDWIDDDGVGRTIKLGNGCISYNYDMPNKDYNLHAVLSPHVYFITLYNVPHRDYGVLTYAPIYVKVPYNTSIDEAIINSGYIECQTGMIPEFYTYTEDNVKVVYKQGTLMPAQNLEGYIKMVPREYAIEWKDGEKTEITYCKYGDIVAPPAREERSDGSSCVWYLDDEPIGVDFVMPPNDMTFTAKWESHNWEYDSEVPSDCSTHGVKRYVCKDCGMWRQEALPLDPNTHPKSELYSGRRILVQAATCSTPNYWQTVCQKCGMEAITDDGWLNPLSHKMVFINEGRKDPTCVDYGYFGRYECTLCGACQEGNRLFPTGKHTYEHVRYITEVTCENPGVEELKCSVCEDTITREVPPIGHDYRRTKIVSEGTCVKLAVEELTCSHCGDIITRDIPNSLNPDRHEHLLEEQYAKKANCGDEGYTGDTVCADCKKVLALGKTIPVQGEHSLLCTKVIHEATCCSAGLGEYTCQICKHNMGEREIEGGVNPDRHENIVTNYNATKETCGTDGYTGDTYCTGCKKTLSKGKVIPATGNHSFSFTRVIREATTTAYGEEEYTCTVCKKTEKRTTPKLTKHEHTPVTRGARKETCQQDGYTGDTVCSECGSVLQSGTKIPKHAHTVAAYTEKVAPTYAKEGTEEGECSECHQMQTRSIPKIRMTVKVIYIGPGFTDGYNVYETFSSDSSGTIKGKLSDLNGRKFLYWDMDGVKVNAGARVVWEKPANNGGDVIYLPDFAWDDGEGPTVFLRAEFEPISY